MVVLAVNFRLLTQRQTSSSLLFPFHFSFFILPHLLVLFVSIFLPLLLLSFSSLFRMLFFFPFFIQDKWASCKAASRFQAFFPPLVSANTFDWDAWCRKVGQQKTLRYILTHWGISDLCPHQSDFKWDWDMGCCWSEYIQSAWNVYSHTSWNFSLSSFSLDW